MARDFKRSDRVADLIQREISTLVVNGVKDPRIGLATITGVRVSDDLGVATVYYSHHGDEAEKSQAQKGFESARGFFRAHLRKVTDLRHIPEIRFRYDKAMDEGEHIERLLSEVRKGEG